MLAIWMKKNTTKLVHKSTTIITPGTIIFLGNMSNSSAITEGDNEMVAILTTQIGQALNNAHLFEEVFKSSQVLESKVVNRTRQLASALEKVQNISKAKSEFISAVCKLETK